jgi:hypothetical protein
LYAPFSSFWNGFHCDGQHSFHTLWIRVRDGTKPSRKAIPGVTHSSTKAMAGGECGFFQYVTYEDAHIASPFGDQNNQAS